MLKLHFAPGSRALRIAWLLEELELDYELNIMRFHPEDLKSDKHRARHPLGRVPVLEDDDETLWESGAIVEYILEKHKKGDLKPSVEAPVFGKYLQWFHYCEGMAMPPINTIMVHTVILPPDRRDPTVLSQAQKLLTRALAPVDDALEGKDYLIGDFSAADIMLGQACIIANRLGCVPDNYARLRSYVERLQERPAWIKAESIK